MWVALSTPDSTSWRKISIAFAVLNSTEPGDKLSADSPFGHIQRSVKPDNPERRIFAFAVPAHLVVTTGMSNEDDRDMCSAKLQQPRQKQLPVYRLVFVHPGGEARKIV